MNLKSICYIPGVNGLFKVISQAKGGFVAESLVDKKRNFYSISHRVVLLEEVSNFTKENEKLLSEVLTQIKEKGIEPVDPKSDSTSLKNFFKTVVTDYDEERVHDSDIKKVINWFNMLKNEPEYWVKKETVSTEEGKPVEIQKPEEKVHTSFVKETAKVGTHDPQVKRVFMSPKRGG